MEKQGPGEKGGQEAGADSGGPQRVGPQASRVGQGSQRGTRTHHLPPVASNLRPGQCVATSRSWQGANLPASGVCPGGGGPQSEETRGQSREKPGAARGHRGR